jgi:vacuolar-type H+-ATPase subunit H
MPSDTVQRIWQAESKAKVVIYNAECEADVILRQAKEDAVRIVDDAVHNAKVTAERRIADANHESQRCIDVSQEILNEEKEALITKAKTNHQEAINKIVEIIVG